MAIEAGRLMLTRLRTLSNSGSDFAFETTLALKAQGAPSPYSPLIAKGAQLPVILPQSLAHAGIILALMTAVLLWVLLVRSPLGYQIAAVGFNPTAAYYARISVKNTIMLVMGLAGGLAGLAGASEVMGLKYRLFEQVSSGYGFDAIAALIFGRWHPLSSTLACFLFGATEALQLRIQALGVNIPYQFLVMLPYAIALFALLGLAGKSIPPQGLGVPYSPENQQEN